jgi:outer membrane assembly lipoprotein YfiO
MPVTVHARRLLALAALLLALSTAAGCGAGSTPTIVPDQDADTYLFTQGSLALERGRWLTAREYLRRLVDTYPTSQHRQNAKLGIGDSYLGERRIESDILAAAEFREFLRFYPLAPRADYAQYRLAVAYVRQVLSPERDQTATHDALRELRVFTTNYPTSSYMADALKLERETRDRLSQSEMLIGRHYVRSRWYPGAVTRLEALLKTDPQFTGRDGVYFFLAEAYNKQDKKAEARVYYQKVIDEFRVSEYLDDARKRLAVLGPDVPASAATPAPDSARPSSRSPQSAPVAGQALPPAGSSTAR